MQHFPQPLATSAACDVMPPFAVSIASATCIPCTSSGEVSSLTRITLSPFLCHSSASSAVNTIRPVAPPGPAGSPFVRILADFSASESNIGCKSSSNCSGFTRNKPASFVIIPSLAISTAIFIAADPFLLPTLVWSIQSFPSCIVNSMSCISA